jgi:nitrosourea synthase
MTTMTRGAPLPTVFQEAHSTLSSSLQAFARNPLFAGGPNALHGPNPYRRMLTADALGEVDFGRPLSRTELDSFRSLAGHRMLGTFYEAETVLLPEQGLNGLRGDFDLFYSEELRRLREGSLSELERFAFAFLADDVDVPGNWSIDALDAYFHHVVAEADASDTAALLAIEASPRPDVAADTYLVQLALDGLTEASAMSRNLAGAYGPEQSALFKIFIDEFGYGVYEAKHTSIFAKMLRSRAMATHVHAYWNFYLAGPLATNNFYYYVSRDHAKFFRYAGAVTFAERVFAPGFDKMIRTYRGVFGDEVDLHYCEEHAHIDQHHGRITREQVLLALAERHGPSVIPELVRGMAEARVLGRWFDEDTAAQIRWADAIERHRELGARALPAATHQREVQITPASPIGTRSHDQDTLVVIDSGEADLITTATGAPDRMARGDAVLVPAGRVYALQAVSPTCGYSMLLAPVEP